MFKYNLTFLYLPMSGSMQISFVAIGVCGGLPPSEAYFQQFYYVSLKFWIFQGRWVRISLHDPPGTPYI